MEGVQLEDQGGAGTALSHWEKRIVEVNYQNITFYLCTLQQNEGMTGIISRNPKFSRITFALLEDSG